MAALAPDIVCLQEVTTGWRTERTVEILSGLREGDVLELNEQS